MSEQTAKWQQLAEANRRRVEEWLSGGRSRGVRTRGAAQGLVRTRSAAPAQMTVDDGLQWLMAELPQAAWAIVVDGSWDAFADRFCQQARARRDDCKFWLIESAKTVPPGNEVLARLDPMRLNVDRPNDERLCRNLVADLVLLPSSPVDSQQERVKRWLSHCYYMVIEGPSDLRPEDIQEDRPIKQYRAPVFVAEGERLWFFE